MRCCLCNLNFEKDELIETPRNNFVCASCHSLAYTFCDQCGTQIVKYSEEKKHDNKTFCFKCYSQFVIICDYCKKEFSQQNIIETDDGSICCKECYNKYYSECSNCRCYYKKKHMVEKSCGHVCYMCEKEIYNWEEKVFICDNLTYNETKTNRLFGVEIETSYCKGFSDLNTIFGCKDDYSISGKEFITPPLCGDQGLSRIKDFCDIANINNWKVNDTCGLHLHLDLSNETFEQLKSIAYAYFLTYKVWGKFVSENRYCNDMCGAPKYTENNILEIKSPEDWDYFVSEQDRFEFINWRSYIVHGTLEIRILSGTLNAEEICNWIKLHLYFINFVKNKSIEELQSLFKDGNFDTFYSIIGANLFDYYSNKMKELCLDLV